MSLQAEIRRVLAADPDADPMRVARRLLRTLSRTELTRLLAEEVAHEQRVAVREIERAAFGAVFDRETFDRVQRTRGETADARIESFRPLLGAGVHLGDGTTGVTWGNATIAQHQQRIAFLTRLRQGLDRTIEMHQQAIATLASSGARCLDDLAIAA